MKTLILFLVFTTSSAYAVPVLNRNMAVSGHNITIWPDHKDPNHFYFAPTKMVHAEDANGKIMFNSIYYTEGRCRLLGRCEEQLHITTFFKASYNENDFTNATEAIRNLVPQARFSPVPFVSSKVEFGQTMFPFITEHNCAPIGGLAIDMVPCTMILNQRGVNRLIPSLEDGHILAFNFIYSIIGVVEEANSEFRSFEAKYAIAVELGGDPRIEWY